MDQVSLVKVDVRKNQWAELIQACQSNGMTVKAGCNENGINIKSYCYRLKSWERIYAMYLNRQFQYADFLLLILLLSEMAVLLPKYLMEFLSLPYPQL